MNELSKSTRKIIASAVIVLILTIASLIFIVSSGRETRRFDYPLTVISKGEKWGETLNNHDPVVVTCLVRVKGRTGDFTTLSGLEYCSLKAGDEIK